VVGIRMIGRFPKSSDAGHDANWVARWLELTGRESHFPMFADSRRWIGCAYRRRAALRRQPPQAAVGQELPFHTIFP